MKIHKHLTLLAVAFLFSGFALTATAQKIDLSYNLTVGDTYDYEIKSDQDITIETGNQTMVMGSNIGFEMTSLITEFTSDSAKVKSTIDRVTMNQKILGMEIKYDSDNEPETQDAMTASIAKAFKDLIGHSYVMTMDHKGNVGDIDFSDMSKNNDLVGNLSSGSNYATYPDKKVGVGDTWEVNVKPVEGSDMKYYVKYTVKKITGSEVTLGMDGKISSNYMGGTDMEIKGTVTGEMVVDRKSGWLIRSTIDQQIDTKIKQGGQVFPATIDGTTVTTCTKK